MKLRKIGMLLMAAFIATSCLTACGSNGSKSSESKKKPVVKLATMTDEEGRIIGSMMQQVLEANGYKVDSKVGTFNNTTLMRKSIEQKQADLSLDYTGRGMMFIKDVDTKKYQGDLETAYKTTKEADEKNGIIWLAYAPFNNTDGIAVRKDWAEKNNVHTLEDFAKYVNSGGEMKLAINGPDSYVTTAETCLPGWEKAYGFKLKPEQIVVGVQDSESMASKNTDGVIATHVYTTSGSLNALNLVVLKDTKVVSPVFSPAPIASKDFIEKNPEVAELLEPVLKSLDEDTIRELNTKVSKDGMSEKEVARQYLQEKGFLK